jgi:hypothetical protein
VLPGSTVDLGWTGMAHRQAWPSEQRLAFDLACPDDGAACRVGGGEAGALFGAPVPLAAGGVPVCVVNTLREPLAGTVEAARGCGELRLRLTARVHMAPELPHPCPLCAGDPTPNDGRKDGRCEAGGKPGAACDAHGTSAIFGATSHDCPPTGTQVGALAVDLDPLTTGAARAAAGTRCKRASFGADCFCAAQPQPNDCEGGRCAASETCEGGPFDGTCAKQPFRGCGVGSDDVCGPAGGACEFRPRGCFGSAIAAAGACDPRRPVYTAVFCVAATSASALNNAAGLPGPARLRLELEVVN